MLGSLIYNTLSTSPSLVRQTCASQATQKGWFHVKCVGGRPGIWGSHFRVPGPTLSSWDFSSCRQPHAAFCRLSGLAGPAGTARGSPLCEESNVNQGDSLGSSTLLCSPGSCSNHHCSLCPLQCLQTAVIWGGHSPANPGTPCKLAPHHYAGSAEIRRHRVLLTVGPLLRRGQGTWEGPGNPNVPLFKASTLTENKQRRHPSGQVEGP